MKQKKIRRSIGKFLKKLREENNINLTDLSRYLAYYQVKCSRTNLLRIEQENSYPRGDILAALGIIYDRSVDSIVYSNYNESE